ncbi:hypothetical protein ANN_17679 [Periplaneta americana]|uniref:Uncharacterized protein n=1 Tax=Periplaneta americana TaxID=6978 RepID=A0ABQ8STM8_PERAM|nr:hypothetical protein ANN_17679 [Periplaneta americana]
MQQTSYLNSISSRTRCSISGVTNSTAAVIRFLSSARFAVTWNVDSSLKITWFYNVSSSILPSISTQKFRRPILSSSVMCYTIVNRLAGLRVVQILEQLEGSDPSEIPKSGTDIFIGLPEDNEQGTDADSGDDKLNYKPQRRNSSPVRFKKWTDYSKRKYFNPGSNAGLCSLHVIEKDFDQSQLLKIRLLKDEKPKGPKLKPGSVPSVKIISEPTAFSSNSSDTFSKDWRTIFFKAFTYC